MVLKSFGSVGHAMSVRPGKDEELRAHDLLVGLTVGGAAGVALATGNPVPVFIYGAVGATMVQSSLTGFCPVHWLLTQKQLYGPIETSTDENSESSKKDENSESSKKGASNFGSSLKTRPGCDNELRTHDGLVGAVFTCAAGTALAAGTGLFATANCVVLGVTGLMCLSFFTGYCPVHHALKVIGLNNDVKKSA